MATIRKTYRVDEQTDAKIKELLNIYGFKTENELFQKIIDDIYRLKKSKALVPYEELDKRDVELKKLYFELGKLKAQLEEKEKKRSFWSRLFSR